MLVIATIVLTGLTALSFVGLTWFVSILLVVPPIVPVTLYFAVAPNRSFDYEQYRTQRGTGGLAVDATLMVAASTVCVPTGIAVRAFWLSEFAAILVTLAVAILAGQYAFIRRNEQFYGDGVNPWLSGPMLPR